MLHHVSAACETSKACRDILTTILAALGYKRVIGSFCPMP